MCGLAGFIGQFSTDHLNILKAMSDEIAHRGPDGEGYFANGQVALAHRRLAIIDLSEHGSQPMHYLSRYVIVYNGEIYNYIELRSELKAKGYNFESQSDTEVLLASFDCWGVDCLHRFNGMWSFVLYDLACNKFFVSIDRFGIKPLYYYHADNLFIFASEIKAVLRHPAVARNPNLSYLDDYLVHGADESQTQTAFAEVSRFPQAAYYFGTLDNFTTSLFTKYWEHNVNTSQEPYRHRQALQYASQYYSLLYDAVKIRLRSDVPVGMALSGGIDSSSIVYLANQILSSLGSAYPPQTFSSVYRSNGTRYCDESKYINRLTEHLHVHNSQIEPSLNDIPIQHELMIKSMDNPPETTCMSGWHVFKLVKSKNIKVTLDGQGADEQLGGYCSYYYPYLAKLPLFDLIAQSLFLAYRYPLNRTIIKAVLKALINRLAKNNASSKIVPFNSYLASDFDKNLVTLLHYSDRVSMAHSVESRMPFMDYRLVEFLDSVPACYKIHNGWSKYLARLAFHNHLPDSICWRKDKLGWPTPERFWFSSALRPWFRETIDHFLESDSQLGKTLYNKVWKLPRLRYSVRSLNIAVFYKVFFS